VKVLDGHPAKFAPDERFGYSNGGYVLLALISERATGVPFAELVRRRVTEPAGMTATEFHRSDELPATAAIGYLTERGPRTNVFHLPVRGSGDGGIYTTAGDMSTFWQAFFAGRIVRETTAAEMMRPRSDAPPRRYGLGFWLDGSSASVMLIGTDAGVSFRSVHDPSTPVTQTVISNTTTGARAIARFLDERL
jgi:CubicO group peptidase (beta-lactamase class C family)